jgi:hypothetical protein
MTPDQIVYYLNLSSENWRLKAENARLREALKDIIHLGRNGEGVRYWDEMVGLAKRALSSESCFRED